MSLDAATVKAAAAGRWLFILEALAPALHPAIPKRGRHVPCPVHGGTDGFRLFKDADQTGGGICNTCGDFADGFALLQWLNGWDFPTTLRAVAGHLGLVGTNGHAAGERTEAERREYLARLWRETRPDEGRLAAYLRSRGLSGAVPRALRFHPSLSYYDADRRHLGDFPAMVARVQRLDGEMVALHRTYLAADGPGKAPVDRAKKLTQAVREGATRGGAIRLAEPDSDVLALTEGIETGLAVMEATGLSTWACVSAGGLEAVEVPPHVRRVRIYADHDANGRGQQAAAVAALRLRAEGREVAVYIPPAPDTDWLDVLTAEGPEAIRRARPTSVGALPGAERTTAAPDAAGGPRLAWETAAEFCAAEPEAVPWIARPYLAAQAVTEFDGVMKLGKTTWVLALVAAILDGRPFLGEPTVRTPVVYLTEQPRTSFAAALRRAGLEGRADLHILCWSAAARVPWPEVVADAAAKAEAVGSRVLVVDTFSQWARLPDENDAAAALAASAPIQEAVARGLAIVLVRHERKSGGEVGQAARGSSAIGGIADIIVSLRRPEGRHAPNFRVLHAVSRFDETPGQLVVEWTGHTYEARGTETNVATQAARSALLEEAPDDRAHAVTLDAILARRPGISRPTLRREARQLVEAGALRTVGGGHRGDPLRYYRPPAEARP